MHTRLLPKGRFHMVTKGGHPIDSRRKQSRAGVAVVACIDTDGDAADSHLTVDSENPARIVLL